MNASTLGTVCPQKELPAKNVTGPGGGTITARPQLFRQETLDFQRNYRQWGDVASLQPLSVKVTGWFLAPLIGRPPPCWRWKPISFDWYARFGYRFRYPRAPPRRKSDPSDPHGGDQAPAHPPVVPAPVFFPRPRKGRLAEAKRPVRRGNHWRKWPHQRDAFLVPRCAGSVDGAVIAAGHSPHPASHAAAVQADFEGGR
jgi:hypothetical protein